jgi:divalent metal cation (Fe/Co/Zn/Cd) transporter
MTNQLVVQNAELAIQQLRNEIAAEFGIEISPEMTTREAGKIGGEITKRLVALGEQKLAEMAQEHTPQTNQQSYNQLH